MAPPDRHRRPGQRLDPAPLLGALGRDGPAPAGPRPAGRHAARPPGPDPRHLLGPRQARRRPDRAQSDGPRQARHQVPHRHRRGRRAGGLRRHRGQRERHAPLRAPLPGRPRGHGAYRTVFADRGYDAEHHRRRDGCLPPRRSKPPDFGRAETAHMGRLSARARSPAHHGNSGWCVRTASRVEPVSLFWQFRTGTTSHSVGARSSRTTIPLTAGRAQEGETIL